MEEQLKISIVTVSYNAVKTIEQTIKSVINQTYSNIEYIVVDGGSTDGTVDIIRKYEDRIAYWVSEPDGGIFDAMNKGIKIATGEVVGIINSDDWYEHDAVEMVAREFSSLPKLSILVGNMYERSYEGEILDLRVNGALDTYIKKVMPVNHPAMFVRMSVYLEYGMYNVAYVLSADYDFVCRAYSKGCFIKYNSKVFANLREDGATSSFSTLKGLRNCFRLAEEEYLIQRENFGQKNILRRCRRYLFSLIKYVFAKCGVLYWGTVFKRKYLGRWI